MLVHNLDDALRQQSVFVITPERKLVRVETNGVYTWHKVKVLDRVR